MNSSSTRYFRIHLPSALIALWSMHAAADMVIVHPGESIQAAIDAAAPGTTILVRPGLYHEQPGNANALEIAKDGIRLVGLTDPSAGKPILENDGGQDNGIVVTPETECAACHSSAAPGTFLRAERSSKKICPSTGMKRSDASIHGFELRNFVIRGFNDLGVFTRHLDVFRIVGNDGVDNGEYSIFPTLSSHGMVANNYVRGANDSGIWVETSQYVVVKDNIVEDNVNGFEISNSLDILVTGNESRNNTAGISLFLLPFLDTQDARRIVVINNWLHDNNRPNTAGPDEILSLVPPGTGILNVGVNETHIVDNQIENHGFVGIAIADYCLATTGTDFDCTVVPIDVDPNPEDNHVTGNIVINSGYNPPPPPFGLFAADLAYLVTRDGGQGNCFKYNQYQTAFPSPLLLPRCN